MPEFEPSPEQAVLCQQMARLARVGGFIVDLASGRCLWCSDEVARIHGLAVADCADLLSSEQRLEGSRHADDRERYRQARAAARESGGAYTVEYRLRNAQDQLLWLSETGEHLADGRLVGSIRDLTAERRAEEGLQQSNETSKGRLALRAAELQAAKDAAEAAEREARASHERFLAAAESLRDGLAIYDSSDRLVYHNRRYPDHAPPAFRAAMRIGARFEDMVRSAVEAGGMYHPDMGGDFIEERLAHHSAPAEDQEFRIADGRWIRVRENALPSGGRVLLTSDVTAQRAAQVELEEREQLLRRIADGIPLPIVITRIRQPEVLFANELAIETFNLRLGPQPEAIRDAYVDPGDRRLLIEQLYRDGRVDGLEVRLRRADGTPMWALLSARAITIHGQLAMLTTVTDISERKAAQIELEEREQRFRAIAEGVPLSIVIGRPDPPRILFANARAEEAFGLHAGLEGDAVLTVYVRPDDRTTLMERLAVEGRVDSLEVELRRPNGSTLWALMSARTLTFGGQPAVLTAVTDISERKRIEEALRASEARLAAFTDNAPVGMYLKDLDGRYVLANPEMTKVFARPAEEMLGLTAADAGVTHDLDLIAAADRAVLESGRVQVAEEYAPDLEAYSWSLVIRFPILDGQARTTHIGGFHVDITGQKATEQQLKASEQRFRAFAEAHPVPLFIADLDTGRVIFASPPCAELLRTPLPQLLAGTTLSIYADPADRPGMIDLVRRQGFLNGTEVRLRRADGSEFWGAFTSKLITFEGKDAVVTAIVDLTEPKRVEAELERQRQILNQNEKMSALGSLLAGVAHELNNPLSVVVGHAGLLEELAPDEATRERALKIRTSADRCARIVRTFLAMARSKPRQRGPVQLNATIEAALEIVAYGLRTADIEVVRQLAPDLPPVWADGDQLHQVFANLFVNAQQALQGSAGPRQLIITTRHDDASVFVEVADNGPGIPAEIASRIFDPFFTTKPQGVGTGVGLSVCHGVLAAHDGEISLKSEPGQGATFVVRLPRSEVTGETVAAEASAQPWRRGRILVVDDEPDIGQLLADVLERDGHSVERALSGRDALQHLRDGAVDLIISDLRMPDMDGPALYRALTGQRPELAQRMVFVTGDTLAADLTGFLSEIGARVIEKPLDPQDISRKVQTLLADGG
ncbi:MAG TPA: PAS domain S-box protein [Geminicoccaceae bacterium]|nr:PAS domain S-box protein [Geminicoccaceae bacterium]